MNYIINMTWDEESSVWVATSDNVPGLVLESGSFDALIERVRFAIPEMLELNSKKNQHQIPLIFRSERKESLAV